MKKYMVMECHPGYAVVLDGDGHFLKVANRHYEIGQLVTDVIEMQIPQPVSEKKKIPKWIYSLTAAAACMLLIITSVFRTDQTAYASVYMSINPQVRIDVNRKDIVVGLEGINADGRQLIDGYHHKKKELDLVMDELVDRAIDMGYLHEGGQISLVLDADSNEWIISHSDTLTSRLNEHLSQKLTVTIEVMDTPPQNEPLYIPASPGETDYGESDYETDDSNSSDYEIEDSNVSDYEMNNGAASDYELDDSAVSDYELDDDAVSDYETDDD